MSVSIITLYVTVLKRLASDILGSTLEDIFVIAKRSSISKGWRHSLTYRRLGFAVICRVTSMCTHPVCKLVSGRLG